VPLDHRKEADDKMMTEENAGKTKEQLEEEIAAKEAKSRADVLVMVGDLQSADAKPPDDVLFVCKLHPVTQEDDLGKERCVAIAFVARLTFAFCRDYLWPVRTFEESGDYSRSANARVPWLRLCAFRDNGGLRGCLHQNGQCHGRRTAHSR
jgi:hypothetical protein